MDNIAKNGTNIIPVSSYPVILIGGAPNAGKSVLTYNLTRELRARKIPHFVFRASTDFEGDWFLNGDFETVQEIRNAAGKMKWTDTFRSLVCQNIVHRQFPLIVDIGGLPREADIPIFQLCSHSILLLKDDEPQASEKWQRFTACYDLQPLAELRSQLQGRSDLVIQKPILQGIITNLTRRDGYVRDLTGDSVFNALLDAIVRLFRPYSQEEVEKAHYASAPRVPVVHLERELSKPHLNLDKWKLHLLEDLLASLPANTEMAAYGRAPNWVYGALAMHTYPQPFHQFDACIGWVQPQPLLADDPPYDQRARELITLRVQAGGDSDKDSDAYIVRVSLNDYFIDYKDANQLVFPEPPTPRGVIISGKLPFWLFTSLARFYADRHASWIAVNYASDSRPVVVYSRVASHPIGKQLPKLHDLIA